MKPTKFTTKQNEKDRERLQAAEQERERELQRQKQKTALQESYKEMLNNLISTNIVKPTNVEAQRILNILDELVEDIEILSFLDTDFLINFLNLNNNTIRSFKESIDKFTPQTFELLRTEAKLEYDYHAITKPEEEDIKEKKEDEENEEGNEENKEEEKIDEEEKRKEDERKQQEIEKYRDQLAENLKELLRALRKNDTDFNVLKVKYRNFVCLFECFILNVKTAYKYKFINLQMYSSCILF